MFWEQLEKICKSRNITPSKLAKELNFSNAIATAWKKGSPPNSERLCAIADYFGVTTDYLLGRSGADPELPEDERELLHNYRRADENGKKRIRSHAREEAEENQPEQRGNVS